MNPKHISLLFGDPPDPNAILLYLQNRVIQVCYVPLPLGLKGFIRDSGIVDQYRREVGFRIFIHRPQSLWQQVVSLAHELIHIPFFSFPLPPCENAVDHLAEYFVQKEWQLIAQAYVRRVEILTVLDNADEQILKKWMSARRPFVL